MSQEDGKLVGVRFGKRERERRNFKHGAPFSLVRLGAGGTPSFLQAGLYTARSYARCYSHQKHDALPHNGLHQHNKVRCGNAAR